MSQAVGVAPTASSESTRRRLGLVPGVDERLAHGDGLENPTVASGVRRVTGWTLAFVLSATMWSVIGGGVWAVISLIG